MFKHLFFFVFQIIMTVRIVLGAQWGDEGKGKIVDLLSNRTRWVARYQGGANAGHTLKFEDTEFVLHLVPSGIFHKDVRCVIGNGTVIDPDALLSEIEAIEKMGTETQGRLFVSETAHVILPYHKTWDQAHEASMGDQKIGTTGRGIGPAYVHKISRSGIRMMDLLDEEELRNKVTANAKELNIALKGLGSKETVEVEPVVKQMLEAGNKLKPYIIDTVDLLNEAHTNEESIMLEGAQGSLLDVDHGTYPYVTSSSPTSGGACIGTGLPPSAITNVMGITKAYCTRVGNGPFPTELLDETGELLRKTGYEFGATTGRPRRCGWIDLVALRYAVRINGINEIALTKLDVLDRFDEIKLCTDYLINGQKTRHFPLNLKLLEKAEPVYTTLSGWQESTVTAPARADLPSKTQEYLRFIEEYLQVSIRIISTGPKRSQTIVEDLN